MGKLLFYDLKFRITSETSYLDDNNNSKVLEYHRPLMINITIMKDSKDSKKDRVRKILEILEKELMKYESL